MFHFYALLKSTLSLEFGHALRTTDHVATKKKFAAEWSKSLLLNKLKATTQSQKIGWRFVSNEVPNA